MPQFPVPDYNLTDTAIQAMAEPALFTLVTCKRCPNTFFNYVDLPQVCSACWTPADTEQQRGNAGQARGIKDTSGHGIYAKNGLEDEIDKGVPMVNNARCGDAYCDECVFIDRPADCDDYNVFLYFEGERLAPEDYKCNGVA